MIWNVNLWVHGPNANIVSYLLHYYKKMGGDESEADRIPKRKSRIKNKRGKAWV